MSKSKSLLPNKGFAPVLVLILLSVSLASAIYIATLFMSDKTPSSAPDNSVATEASTNAFQAANSGSEAVLKKIYKEDNPADLTALAEATGSECVGGVISGSTSVGSYKVSLYDGSGDQLKNCNDSTWRGQVAKLKSDGTSGDTSRGIDVAVAAEPTPGITGGCNANRTGYSVYSNPMDGSSVSGPVGTTLWGELSIGSRWGSGCKAQKAPDLNARNTFQANKYINTWGIAKADAVTPACQLAADDNHQCGSNQINSSANGFGNTHTCFCVRK